WAPETLPQPVADVVADHGAEGRGGDDRVELEQTRVGEEPRREHQTLARHHESSERGAFQGRRHKDDEITPLAEPGDETEEILEHATVPYVLGTGASSQLPHGPATLGAARSRSTLAHPGARVYPGMFALAVLRARLSTRAAEGARFRRQR